MASLAKCLLIKLYSRPYLLVTNTVTGVISISIGDFLQQNLEHYWSKTEKNDQDPFVWNRTRTRNMMIAGVYFSLFGHWWYTWLDRKFPPQSKDSIRKKLMAESISGPLLVSSVFLLFGNINGQKMESYWENLRSSFGLVCAAEWMIFIPIQWVNFYFVPITYRYLYVASVSIGYDAILSYILHRNERFKCLQQQQRTIPQLEQMF